MKSLFTVCFLLSFLSAQTQQRTFKLYAVGVDGFKNLPFLILPKEETGFSKPAIFEGYGLFKMKKPSVLLNLGLGFASINYHIRDRLSQHITGFYVKIGRERYNRLERERTFWGYSLTLISAKVAAAIDVHGQYFPSYYTPLPTKSGLGMSGDLFMGLNFLLFRRLETRFIYRTGLSLSNIGNPNAAYLPGAGIRLWKLPLTSTQGATIQLFYLTKRVPKLYITH